MALLLASACTTPLGGRTDAGLSGFDSGPLLVDAFTPSSDAASIDAPVDAGSAPVDAAAVDAAASCTPTRTSCNMALECGAIPNGCPRGAFACVACSGGETYCATLAAPRWRGRVSACVSSVSAANPGYFDATMSCSTGTAFVVPSMAAAYVHDVATCADGSGALAIVDPNAPQNEIRVRGTDDDIADNYSVRLYGSGCSTARYTSSCTPSLF